MPPELFDWIVKGSPGFLGSGLATALVGFVFHRRNKQIEAEIKAHFDESFTVFQTTRAWRQQALSELFGPLLMQFQRTESAFNRWTTQNLYLEANVVRLSNQTIRDLLLANGHLIPPHLIECASELVVHYDTWLEEFDRVRGDPAKSADQKFIYVGPKGFPFPRAAELAFKAEFETLQKQLYGLDKNESAATISK